MDSETQVDLALRRTINISSFLLSTCPLILRIEIKLLIVYFKKEKYLALLIFPPIGQSIPREKLLPEYKHFYAAKSNGYFCVLILNLSAALTIGQEGKNGNLVEMHCNSPVNSW